MILRSMTIEGFRSIQKPETLYLDRKVTTIAGGNDHGKSNVLIALKHLMMSNKFVTEDLCRANQDFDDDQEFPHICYEFYLDDTDPIKITNFVKNNLSAKLQAAISAAEVAEASATAATQAAQVHEATLASSQVPDDIIIEDSNSNVSINQQAASLADQKRKEAMEFTVAAQSARDIADDISNIPWLKDIKSGMKIVLSRKGVGKDLELVEPIFEQEFEHFFDAVYEILPNVEIVEEFPELKASVTLENIEEPEYEVMQGIVKMAGLWEVRDSIFSAYGSDPQARKTFSAAKEHLNQSLKGAWAQGGDYDYQINMSGGTLHFDISDQTGHHDVPAVRGLGLRSFLEFHLTLLSRTGEFDPQGYIFAFDEPGPHLHPQGQKDLLRIIEQLAVKNQIIYVTHSLFLINRNYPQRTVLVTKNAAGTHINGKPF